MNFDVIKVASCSAKDWPLLEKIAAASKPVIFSTGGLTLEEIDDVVSFFDHRGVDFAIMHCVSLYPIPDEHFQLNQITVLRNRHPSKVIGWSTHENPDELAAVQMAAAKGARMFERHVGMTTDTIKLNAYSSTADQVDRWIAAYKKAVLMCGADMRPPAVPEEAASIDTLRRGVYARQAIGSGQALLPEDVYFAMPYVDGQVESGQWKAGIVARAEFVPDAPILRAQVEIPTNPDYHALQAAVHDVKAMLNEARIVLNSEFDVEYSHHYGIQNFRKFGAVIINCINREYCKKIIVQLPGQKHPPHFHRRKEETFQVLYGELTVNVDGHLRTLRAGQTCLVQAGVWHSFWTDTGCIVEEISTTHYNDDSFYKDKRIASLDRWERKTKVNHWGRWELADKRQMTAFLQPGADNAEDAAREDSTGKVP
jgi:N-acetylneuraminate synthase